jgi:integrase
MGSDGRNGRPKNSRMTDTRFPTPAGAPQPAEARLADATPTQNVAAQAPPPPRLLDRLRTEIRTRHYSIRTEASYVDWARRFILFHGKRHPQDMGAAEVGQFLSHLATERQVSAATQGQAKSALLFLYSQVLKVSLPWLDEVVTARTQRKLPVVLTPSEVRALLHALSGTTALVVSLL